jgi:hypothetical protein
MDIIIILYNKRVVYFLYYISNKGLVEECDTEERFGSNWDFYYILFEKKIVKRFVQYHIFARSPAVRRPNNKYPVNTSHRSRFVCKCFTTVLFGSSGNSCTVSA